MKTIQFLSKEMPAIGMGTWYMGEGHKPYAEELHAICTGIEAGIQLIDTAEMYGEGLAEKLVGEAITPYNRESLTLVTKVYPWNATKKQTRISLENSLKRMQTDYMDLYLLHWCEDVPLQESVEALMQLRWKERLSVGAFQILMFRICGSLKKFQRIAQRTSCCIIWGAREFCTDVPKFYWLLG